jgi:hypothetical protein
MRRLLFSLLCLLSSGYAFADETALTGIWRGKLGSAEIVACFNSSDAGDATGSYYYVRHKTPIPLKREQGKPTWQEAGGTGAWTLPTPENGSLAGSWRNPKGGNPQALTLSRIATDDTGKACASDAFNLAMEVLPAPQIGKVKEFEGKKYRDVRIADVVTLELLEPGDKIGKINQALRTILPRKVADLSDYFEKRRRFLGESGMALEDETSATPFFWSSHWITINFYRWAAGYGRSGIALDYRTWDLQSGDEINPWEWFIGKPPDKGNSNPLPQRLKKFLFKDVTLDKECRTGYQGQGDYHLTFEADGMKFWEEAFGNGCEQEFVLPYAALGPFLTPKGKLALRDVLSR